MATTYDLIASQTLASAAASITFSSIAATYTDLRLVVSFTTTTGEIIKAQYNSDTATNYSVTAISGNGIAASSFNLANINYIYSTNGSSPTVPQFLTLDIFSYAGSTYKTSLGTQARDVNGSGGRVDDYVHLWRSTSAINAIRLFTDTGNFNIGTTATIYGIKAA